MAAGADHLRFSIHRFAVGAAKLRVIGWDATAGRIRALLGIRHNAPIGVRFSTVRTGMPEQGQGE
jgi:hypothetical protein